MSFNDSSGISLNRSNNNAFSNNNKLDNKQMEMNSSNTSTMASHNHSNQSQFPTLHKSTKPLYKLMTSAYPDIYLTEGLSSFNEQKYNQFKDQFSLYCDDSQSFIYPIQGEIYVMKQGQSPKLINSTDACPLVRGDKVILNKVPYLFEIVASKYRDIGVKDRERLREKEEELLKHGKTSKKNASRKKYESDIIRRRARSKRTTDEVDRLELDRVQGLQSTVVPLASIAGIIPQTKAKCPTCKETIIIDMTLHFGQPPEIPNFKARSPLSNISERSHNQSVRSSDNESHDGVVPLDIDDIIRKVREEEEFVEREEERVRYKNKSRSGSTNRDRSRSRSRSRESRSRKD